MTEHADIEIVDAFSVDGVQVGISRGEKDGEVYYLVALAGEGDELPHALTFTDGELHALSDAIEVASAWIAFHRGRGGLATLQKRLQHRTILGYFGYLES